MNKNLQIIHLDCTFRDGGYYNGWNFDINLIQDYLFAMSSSNIDYVELGFRSFDTKVYRGACAYTTDTFLEQLEIPDNINIGVMMNASEVVKHSKGPLEAVKEMFTPVEKSKVSLIRFACHAHEIIPLLDSCKYLKSLGYVVGLNLMQISTIEDEKVLDLISKIKSEHIDVFYFADSLGNMKPRDVSHIVALIRQSWVGQIGIHTHDNLGYALINTLTALEDGALWLDSTVTGMGRGPGNAKTEYLSIELAHIRDRQINMGPLASLVNKYFQPMKERYGWGTNPYYFLAGKYSIHPTYIQTMLSDPTYREEDLLSVIESLKNKDGNKYDKETLMSGKNFYTGAPRGEWDPTSLFDNNSVLIVGAGPSSKSHKVAIEAFIRKFNPIVIAINTESNISDNLINARIACHPVRLLNDWKKHKDFNQPLITPKSMLPDLITANLTDKLIYDYGLEIKKDTFAFENNFCVVPNSLAISYALSVCTSGGSNKIYLAGFDGYDSDDPRGSEMSHILSAYASTEGSLELISLTKTKYKIQEKSVYSY